MSEDREQDQDKSAAPGEADEPNGLMTNGRPSGSWDELLARAERPVTQEMIAGSRTGLPIPAPALSWIKALLPVFVILVFLFYKSFSAFQGRLPEPHTRALSPVAPGISGVAPRAEESVRLDRETERFVGELEAIAARGDWKAVASAIEAREDERVRNHPVVQAMFAVSRARMGERSLELERLLTEVEVKLQSEERRHGDLIRELRLCRVELIMTRTAGSDTLTRNADLVLALLGSPSGTLRDTDVRINVARTFEAYADSMFRRGSGLFSNNPYLMHEARGYYQAALRPLVAERGWYTLEPISPRAIPEVGRLTEKLRTVNRRIHGVSIPLSGSDSSTWSGRKGDPVHDRPPR